MMPLSSVSSLFGLMELYGPSDSHISSVRWRPWSRGHTFILRPTSDCLRTFMTFESRAWRYSAINSRRINLKKTGCHQERIILIVKFINDSTCWFCSGCIACHTYIVRIWLPKCGTEYTQPIVSTRFSRWRIVDIEGSWLFDFARRRIACYW
jgi:hypothetical protein